MHKPHVRLFPLIMLMVVLIVITLCIRMAAPGFSFYGTKVVDLHYDDDLIIHGGYPSIWRLQFDRLGVTTREPIDFSGYRSLPEQFRTPKDSPLPADYPLAFILNGVRYNIGELTPVVILNLGGSVQDLPSGEKFATLRVGPTANPDGGRIHVRFIGDRPFAINIKVRGIESGSMIAAISYRGGLPLRLPASEKDILSAFGPPQLRDAQVVLPESSGAQPLQTMGKL